MKKLFLFALLLVSTYAAHAQGELYIYQQGGTIDTLQMSKVSSVSHLSTDLHGNRCDDYVLMAVTMKDESVRRYLLTQLDSVVMQRGDIRIHFTHFSGKMTKSSSKQKAPRKTKLEGDFAATTTPVDFFWEDGDHIYLEDGRRDTLAEYSETKELAAFYFGGDRLTADEVTVYYAGQAPQVYNEVRVANNQTQQQPDDSKHIGVAGDCGTATAVRQEDGSYSFELQHHAAYLCFLPYIGNDLNRTVLKQITVRSDSAIAGVFTLSPEGIHPKADTTHVITLTTGDFVIPRMATQNTAAYMVIAPQNGPTRLTCEFTVYDTLLESTGVYSKTIDLNAVDPNMVYVLKANVNNYVVDLGLPVQFLNHNYGASAPEQYGGYYAWGEHEDKGNYGTATYAYQNTDIGREIRLTEYDVAHMRYGHGFSLPNVAEMRMLNDSCTWTWMSINGINGHKVKGPNGNVIFLPAGGYRSGTGNSEFNSRGCYRTTTMVTSGEKKCWYLNFYSNSHSVSQTGADLYLGESLRPVVSRGVKMTDGTLVQVMTDSVQWSVGQTTATLYGSVHHQLTPKTVIEKGFIVGNVSGVTMESGTKITVSSNNGDAYHATFTMPKDTVYFYRAYIKTADDSICYANTLQFGRSLVDLGLPSGNLWSNIDLGTSSPDVDGAFYPWAETTVKTVSTTSNYKWFKNNTYLFPDALRNIQATCHDAAAKAWGSVWMMPDQADIQELFNNCTFTLTTMNGIPGYMLKSKNNSNEIFMSLQGYRNSGPAAYSERGYMASSSLRNSQNTYAYMVYNNSVSDGWYVVDMIPVRPVFKTNAQSASGTPMFVRTLPARKYFDGEIECDTLRGVVRGQVVGDGTTVGFVWWKEGSDVSVGTIVPATADADGHIESMITGLEAGVTYHYQAYINNGTTSYYGATEDITAVGLVDLGLSVKWANVNLGAESEGACGEFYRWGATVPYRNVTQQYLQNEDIAPENGRDIATILWGSSYRMPSKDEYRELIDNCSRTWTTRNGYTGYLFTSNIEGYTDRSVFIPASGYYYDNSNYNLNANADYWTSTVYNGDNAYDLNFVNNALMSDGYGGGSGIPIHNKHHGFSVRAVQDKTAYIATVGMNRNTKGYNEVDTLYGYFTNISGASLRIGIVVGETEDVTIGNDYETLYADNNEENGFYHVEIDNLEKGKTYYYRAFCTNGTTYQYGEVMTFELMDMVDLGLPSGTQWANINVGADTPEAYGDYFAWGETEPKESYTEANYLYRPNGNYVEIGSNISGTEYDAATAHFGQLWRTPSQAECKELVDNCTWTQVTVNGIDCWKVTSKIEGYTDKFIYLPKAGRINGTGNENIGSGLYMPSTRYDYYRCNDFYMPAGGPQANTGNVNYKYKGMSVRPVSNITDQVSTNTYVHITTGKCDWTIGSARATLHGNLAMSKYVANSFGFVIGNIQDVDTSTPANANVITISTFKDGDFTTTYAYDGTAKFYRAFVKVNGTYYLGDIKSITAADMLDVEFRADGSAFNGTTSPLTPVKKGTSSTIYNTEYKRYEADLTGNSYAGTASNFYQSYFELQSDWINRLVDGHTLEVLMKLPSEPSSNSETHAFGNYRAGGSVIDVRSKKIEARFYINKVAQSVTSDITPSAAIYYHVVAVYDKQKGQIVLYVDGVQKATSTVSGNYAVPASASRYYVVGGSPNSANATNGWKGNVVFARIYDEPLTAAQVQTLYNGLK